MKPEATPDSIRRELQRISRARGEDFQRTLTHYAIERLLYRLSRSAVVDRFMLKGAMLFALWTGQLHRATRDLDLAGYGDPSPELLETLFRQLCVLDVEADGLRFDAESVTVSEIREQEQYQGQRIRLIAHLGQSWVKVQVDVGFGDAITPAPIWAFYPTFLSMAAPRLRVYPKETVVAEKLQAMVALGMINSRMKDFYDLHLLAETASFTGIELAQAIRATFQRRQTALPSHPPVAFTEPFINDDQKRLMWRAFLTKNQLPASDDLSAVIETLAAFLLPPLFAAAEGQFDEEWLPGGPWRSNESTKD